MKLTYRVPGERPWGFFLDTKDGVTRLILPDAGGQADILPREPSQLAWWRAQLTDNPRDDIVETWSTVWELRSPGAIAFVQARLLAAGAELVTSRLEFYGR